MSNWPRQVARGREILPNLKNGVCVCGNGHFRLYFFFLSQIIIATHTDIIFFSPGNFSCANFGGGEKVVTLTRVVKKGKRKKIFDPCTNSLYSKVHTPVSYYHARALNIFIIKSLAPDNVIASTTGMDGCRQP